MSHCKFPLTDWTLHHYLVLWPFFQPHSGGKTVHFFQRAHACGPISAAFGFTWWKISNCTCYHANCPSSHWRHDVEVMHALLQAFTSAGTLDHDCLEWECWMMERVEGSQWGRAALGLWAEKESEGRKKNVQQVMRVYEKACCEVAEWMQNTWLDVNVSLLCRGNVPKAF